MRPPAAPSTRWPNASRPWRHGTTRCVAGSNCAASTKRVTPWSRPPRCRNGSTSAPGCARARCTTCSTAGRWARRCARPQHWSTNCRPAPARWKRKSSSMRCVASAMRCRVACPPHGCWNSARRCGRRSAAPVARSWRGSRWPAGPRCLWDAQPLEAAAELEAVWPTLGEGSDPYLRRAVANQLMRVRQALGDSAGAIAIGQTLLGWLQGSDDDASFEADVLNLVAMMQVAQGQVAQGLASIERLSARQRAAGEPMREVYAMTIALSYLAVGRHDDAQAWLDRHTQPPGRAGYAMYDVILALARARLAAARGEPVAPWLERLAAVAPLPTGGLLHRRVALASLRPGPLAELEALLDELRQRGQSGLMRSVGDRRGTRGVGRGRPAGRRGTRARRAAAGRLRQRLERRAGHALAHGLRRVVGVRRRCRGAGGAGRGRALGRTRRRAVGAGGSPPGLARRQSRPPRAAPTRAGPSRRAVVAGRAAGRASCALSEHR